MNIINLQTSYIDFVSLLNLNNIIFEYKSFEQLFYQISKSSLESFQIGVLIIGASTYSLFSGFNYG